jgi:hypothetical protein
MALKVAGESLDTIMRVGRWTSLTYMTYIHAQIGALAKGLAWKMSKQYTFHKVGYDQRIRMEQQTGINDTRIPALLMPGRADSGTAYSTSRLSGALWYS